MVEALQEILSKKYNLEKHKISFFKLHHSGDSPHAKILFFVFDSNKALGVIKIIRDFDYNDKLQHECDAQRKAFSSKIKNISVPKILDSGFVGKHFYTYESFVLGEVVGRKNALKYVDVVGDYQLHVEKKKKVSISQIHQTLSSIQIEDERCQDLLRELSKKQDDVFEGSNHGDLTFMNVLVKNKNIYFIDWENYGERTIWGLDFVHYFIRAHNNQEKDVLIGHFEKLKEKPMKTYEFSVLYLIDQLYDFLEKNNLAEYKKVCTEISNL